MSKVASTREARAALTAARNGNEEVRIERSIRRSDRVTGFVMGIGRKWAVPAVRHDLIILDGYVVVRLDDISQGQPPRRLRVVCSKGTRVARRVAADHA